MSRDTCSFTMADLKEAVLKVVDVEGKTSSMDLATRLKVTHNEIVGAIKSLQAIDAELLSVSDRKIVKFVPTEEGECGQASMCCVWWSWSCFATANYLTVASKFSAHLRYTQQLQCLLVQKLCCVESLGGYDSVPC